MIQSSEFTERAGQALRRWIDECLNTANSAMMHPGGTSWRVPLEADLDREIAPVLATRDDSELLELKASVCGLCQCHLDGKGLAHAARRAQGN